MSAAVRIREEENVLIANLPSMIRAKEACRLASVQLNYERREGKKEIQKRKALGNDSVPPKSRSVTPEEGRLRKRRPRRSSTTSESESEDKEVPDN